MTNVLDRGKEDARRLVAWLDRESPAWRLGYLGYSSQDGKIKLNLKGHSGWIVDVPGREEAFLTEWEKLVNTVPDD